MARVHQGARRGGLPCRNRHDRAPPGHRFHSSHLDVVLRAAGIDIAAFVGLAEVVTTDEFLTALADG
ncbi:hypothetical protein [Amycolatopsis nalaikhensis]|uniref:Uncharacterized protein n=1 Tax=Amycolatopsis nalaikhensis TaxID=715472 RepID=A0ABY8X995_9PSEU|nr:hypothetical protein [Amycolatopsis sp. 2-2]WIV52979.1 hypothetical protein QP939_29050 [Amycolatopsis sp. 2-2]